MCIRDREIPVLIVRNLVYDVIVGTDTLRNIHATIDFTNKTLECTVKKSKHKIKWGYSLSQGSECDNAHDLSLIHISAVVVNRLT